MRRVEEVIDAWFDSGAMPFAQHHYPFENRRADRRPQRSFPADFISEAVDQTRGWFYTLHVLGVLLFDSVAYENCIVLGHVNDEQGRKMSKRLGNVVEPMAVIAETGADALRWYFCVNNPEQPSRFSAPAGARGGAELPAAAVERAVVLHHLRQPGRLAPGRKAVPLRRAAGARPLDPAAPRPADRRTSPPSSTATTSPRAARGIEEFLDDLTNWYIRRSRDRFWARRRRRTASADKESAYQALYEVLTTLSRLIAPFTPFVAEVLHEHLVRSQRDGRRRERPPGGLAGAAGRTARDEAAGAAGWPPSSASCGSATRRATLHGLKTRQPLAAVTLVTRGRVAAGAGRAVRGAPARTS